VVITALGLALCLGLYPLGWTFSPGTFPLNFGPWMLLGLGPTFFGLALMAIYVLSRKDDVPQPDEQVETDTELELEEPPA
jgi:hypothetical protein